MSSSVAARLKMKKARIVRKSPVKATTSTPVSYKSRKVNVPRVKTSVQKKKKTVMKKKTPITKKSPGKRKIDDLSDPEVGQEVTDLVPSSQRRKISGKKVLANIPPAPLDNISFHVDSGASRWRFVYHRKLARERELHVNALNCKEIMSLIDAAGLKQTVTQVGRCFERLVKEFLINVGPEVGKPGHVDYFKAYVRGRAVEFSPRSINKFLNRSEESITEEQVPLEMIAKVLTANQVTEWPASGTIPCSKLSAKYAILHKIGAANWAPSSHTSSVPLHMARMIYAIGTKSAMDFGNYVFDLTMKHGDTFAVKLPIAFPCLLTELILTQHPDLLRANEKEAPKNKPLNFDYRLFIGTHVNDIEIPSARTSGHSGSVPRSV